MSEATKAEATQNQNEQASNNELDVLDLQQVAGGAETTEGISSILSIACTCNAEEL